MTDTNAHRLYIAVRTDMASMTPGRVAAQVSHATSHFHFNAVQYLGGNRAAEEYQNQIKIYETWMQETGTCGTVIILGGSPEVIIQHFELVKGKTVGSFIDPEYGVTDGDITHLVAMETVWWGFMTAEAHHLAAKVSGIGLYTGE